MTKRNTTISEEFWNPQNLFGRSLILGRGVCGAVWHGLEHCLVCCELLVVTNANFLDYEINLAALN